MGLVNLLPILDSKVLTFFNIQFISIEVLEYKFGAHKLLNQITEKLATKSDPKDFSNIIKIDTHIHLAAGMTSNHLLEFIKNKALYFGDVGK